MSIVRKLKSQLSKIKFVFLLTPRVDKTTNVKGIRFIPEEYKTVVLVSADFEMAWASRFSKSKINPLEYAVKCGRLTRTNMPVILNKCEEYDIPITWATVGHLFLEKCGTISNVKHPDMKRLGFFENRFWKFDRGDWYDFDPGSSYLEDPEWYAPDLIKDIVSSKVKHEIGCHTFSHIDCSDSLCPDTVFDSEISECITLAQQMNLNLQSFVHPGHTIGHISNLADFGFTCFRTNDKDTIGYPILHSERIWELRNSAQIEMRREWSYEYQSWRLKEVVKRAIKTRTVCNLWFHPQIANSEFVSYVFNDLFSFLNANRKDIWITTMRDYIQYLNRQIQ